MSFLDSIASKLRGNEVATISFTQTDEDWEIYGLVMALDQGQIIIKSQEHFVSQSRVEAWLSSVKTLPMAIAIASDEILTRKVEPNNLPREELLKLVIPQARPEEFFLQKYEGPEGTFVSIIRTNKLKQMLEIIPEGNQVLGINLSPVAMIPLINGIKQESVRLGGFQFLKVGREVSQIDPIRMLDKTVQLSDDEALDQVYALSYAAGLNDLAGAVVPSDFNVKKALNEYTHKRFLSKFGGYVLGGIFLIFLVNVLFFFQLNQKNEQLLRENSSLISTQEQVKELESYLSTYQDLLHGGEQSIFARCSDELGYSIPASIQLSRLVVHPLYLEEKKAIEKQPSVWVEGVAENAVAYAIWIDQIKDLDWVGSISENAYRQGKFQLLITIKSDV